MLQIEKARRLDIKEDIYFDIIRQKTASLIASCCACGAASSGATQDVIDKMHQFGENIGIAFQIKDDLFDYGPDGVIGKPTGIDIKESKMTLPLIYALMKAENNDRRRIINIIKNHNQDNKKVKEVIAFVKQSGGIEYAQMKMKEYRDKADVILNTFENNVYRQSLTDLIAFTIERNH